MGNMNISIISHKKLEQDSILQLSAYWSNVLVNELNLILQLDYKLT